MKVVTPRQPQQCQRAVVFLLATACVAVVGCRDEPLAPSTLQAPVDLAASVYTYEPIEPVWVSDVDTYPWDVCWYLHDPDEEYIDGGCGYAHFDPPVYVGYVEAPAYGDPWDYAAVYLTPVPPPEQHTALHCEPVVQAEPADTVVCTLSTHSGFSSSYLLSDLWWAFIPVGSDSAWNGIPSPGGGPAEVDSFKFNPYAYSIFGQGKVRVSYYFSGAGPFEMEYPELIRTALISATCPGDTAPCWQDLNASQIALIDSALLVPLRGSFPNDSARVICDSLMRFLRDTLWANNAALPRIFAADSSILDTTTVLGKRASEHDALFQPKPPAPDPPGRVHIDADFLASSSQWRRWDVLSLLLHETAHMLGMHHPDSEFVLNNGRYVTRPFNWTGLEASSDTVNSCILPP